MPANDQASSILYRGATITLEDHRKGIDTNHAQELRGGKWETVRRVFATTIRNPACKPFSFHLYAGDIIGLLLPGALDEQLIAAAQWRIDAPTEFAEAQGAAQRLNVLRDLQAARQAAAPDDQTNPA
jgi:hypothetical protein